MNTITIPDGAERLSVEQHGDKIIIKFTPEKPEFNRGDILKSTITPDLTVIFDKMTSITGFDSIYHNNLQSRHCWSLKKFRHATKEEKQEFFDELDAQGKRWNAETMEIEDIPKFKEGDFICDNGRIMIVRKYPQFYKALTCPSYANKVYYDGKYGLPFSYPPFRFATEEEKQLLLDALEKDGKKWNAEKLCIEDIPQRKFKPGDKVKLKDAVLDKSEEYPYFVSDMHAFISKVLTVKSYTPKGHVFLNETGIWMMAEAWLEPCSSEPEVGELAIFWDRNKKYSKIGIFKENHSGNYLDHSDTSWLKAIKFESREQFLEHIK